MGDERWGTVCGGLREISDGFDWGYTPMAANIQMIFFRNPRGDTLVRVLYNEEDMHLPLTGGPYYRWSDLKEYMQDRIALAKEILEK